MRRKADHAPDVTFRHVIAFIKPASKDSGKQYLSAFLGSSFRIAQKITCPFAGPAASIGW
jgi:hypothetical protein